MQLEISALSKLDALELQRLLGDAAVRRKPAGRSTDAMQDIATAVLAVAAITPSIVAAAVAWALKGRRRMKLAFTSTSKSGASESIEFEMSESDQLDPKVLEGLARLVQQPEAALKQAIAQAITKVPNG